MDLTAHAGHLLPDDLEAATVVARLRVPGERGARLATVRDGRFVDITAHGPTVSDLLERPDLVALLHEAEGGETWAVADVAAATLGGSDGAPVLLSPLDLQVVKAAGVTFARSMIERVIEERAQGDSTRAAEIREAVLRVVGTAISDLRPGSAEAEEVKRVLIAEGLWSQYLEVGIGPDPEIFTKAPVLSTVGTGAPIGVLSRSTWNNPEPEVVLAVTSDGRPVAATLGNDVNLRDFEGRSALLLGEAKDNNGSAAVGPVLRVFDDGFGLDDVRGLEIALRIEGRDGFVLDDGSSMSQMSRRLEELVSHTIGPHHQYPDGFALFTGTLFAPTQDREAPGMGFTHRPGDVVRISTPRLGTLVNTVRASEECPPWEVGIRAFFADLAERGLR
ncbi:fumarylacetoacetate hydrolase [Microbacterium paludicola]|uniref:Fumarylacetoacetate hydrolase n=1 Tax=Microbacterium paludicola TaxID=300019 RepID=A0A4Y9FUK7_9MICO|nr:fumarylacetoacetate hydrolase family protein [Microbacterium paludicola]MBF0817079.1 fumarylacetoacetate hydrolase family protein [Microbacterium paludicola]TFU32211.1 fumarylacetoacetate hydrolase [Microbacterium paludicola]